MGLFNRYGNRYEERRRARQEILLVGLFIAFVILFLGGMLLLSRLGPRAVSEEELAQSAPRTAEQEDALRAEIAKLQSQFDALAEDGDVSATDLEVLQLAIARQRELVDALGSPGVAELDLLNQLEERYATEAGSALHAASVADEEGAKKAAEEGRFDDALAGYTRAIQRQDQINLLYARGEYRDVARLRRLQIERENLEAAPLARKARELTQDARMLMRDDPVQATVFLRQAAALHEQLTRDYRNSRYTDRAAEREVAALLVDVEATTLFRRREGFRAQAAEAVAAGRFTEGAEFVEKAIDTQQAILAQFSASSYADPAVMEALETERQSALSTGLARTADEQEASLRVLLRSRQVESARTLAADWYRGLKTLNEQFQASRFRDEARLVEARFLNLKREDFGVIQDAVYRRLGVLPGDDGRQMLTVEVPQILFSLIMGTNPSSQVGDQLPVDSVDYVAAEEFCQRLGWVLGYPVELPTRADFEAALGVPGAGFVQDHAWFSQNSERRTQPVGTQSANAAGFYDLLGNVAEWIAERRPGDERQALTMGGSVRDSAETVSRIPAEYVNLRERSRFVGFRVVVVLRPPEESGGND